MKCSASICDVIDGGSERRERLHEVGVVSVENDLIFMVIAPCPSVLCEEVMDVCGSVPQGRVGEIEGGRHGGRVFLCGLVSFLLGSSLSSNLFCVFMRILHVSSLNK